MQKGLLAEMFRSVLLPPVLANGSPVPTTVQTWPGGSWCWGHSLARGLAFPQLTGLSGALPSCRGAGLGTTEMPSG